MWCKWNRRTSSCPPPTQLVALHLSCPTRLGAAQSHGKKEREKKKKGEDEKSTDTEKEGSGGGCLRVTSCHAKKKDSEE